MPIRALFGAVVLIATTVIPMVPAHSTDARKKQPRSPGTQIACTRVGCHPIPRGCRIEIERNWDGLPTGYDAVICPYR